MKFIHSYAPFNRDEEFNKNLLLNMLLSALLIKKHYGRIVLYTNQKYAAIIKEIGIPYDEINTTILEGYSEKTFSLSKMMVYMDQNEPFIHVDNDTFIFDKIPFKNDIDFFFAHRDQGSFDVNEYNTFIRLYELYYKPIERINNLPNNFKENLLLNQIPNMSIFGGNDYKTIKDATEKAINLYYSNKELFDENYYHACILEQLLISTFIKINTKKDNPKTEYWISDSAPIVSSTSSLTTTYYPFNLQCFGIDVIIKDENDLLNFIDFGFYRGWVHLGGFKFLDSFQFIILNKILNNLNGEKYIKKLNTLLPEKKGYETIYDRLYNVKIDKDKYYTFNLASESFNFKDVSFFNFGNMEPTDNFKIKKIETLLSSNTKGIFYVDMSKNQIQNLDRYIDTDLKNILTNDIIDFIKSDNGLLLIDYRTEGNLATEEQIEKLSNFFEMHSLKKEDVLFVTSNLLLDSVYNKKVRNFNLFTYNYFEESLWFIDRKNKNQKTLVNHYLKLKYDNQNEIIKHFICLNRMARDHRVVFYCLIKNNENLLNKTYYTIGLNNGINNYEVGKILKSVNNVSQDGINYFNIYNNLNIDDNIEIDHDLKINASANINFSLHNTSFCNVVTETLYDNDTLFFSEKTFKPIYMMQPFIIIGNPHSLKELKKMGYKTFDKWWDESYDDEEDIAKRLLMIKELMIKISNYSLDDLKLMKKEMLEILTENYFNLMKRTNNNIFAEKLVSLGFSKKVISLDIIEKKINKTII